MSSRREGYNLHLRNLASGIDDLPPASTRRRQRQVTEDETVGDSPNGNYKCERISHVQFKLVVDKRMMLCEYIHVTMLNY